MTSTTWLSGPARMDVSPRAGQMRPLATGHEGLPRTVVCKILGDAGHDLVGLDTGLFADSLLGAPRQADAR